MSKTPNDAAALAAVMQSDNISPGAGGEPCSAAASRREPTCADFDIRIGRDGTWFYHASPISRKPLVKLFASVLKREDDGHFYLETPVEKGRIQVDDAPFVAVELNVAGHGRDQRLTFRTNLDDEITADARHPIRVDHEGANGGPAPYLLVRDGLEALIGRAVYYQLVDAGVERPGASGPVLAVRSAGTWFELGSLEE